MVEVPPREIWARPRVGPSDAVLRWDNGHWRRPEPAGADADFREVHETAYVLASKADEDRRQRDRLLELGKGLLELADYEYEPAQLANQIARGDLCPVAKDRLDDLRAAIAECEGKGDSSPPAKGPTPEAGYQSLLRETAGERLGATK